MGELAEGDRTFDAVTDTNAASASINLMQDQLAAMLGPQDLGLTYLGFTSVAQWVYDFTNVEWVSQAGGGDVIIFPLLLRAGQKLTEIKFDLEVVTNGAGGDLQLMRRIITPAGGAPVAVDVVAVIDTDIWDGLTNNTATLMSYTGLSYTIAAEYNYWLYLTARAGIVCTVHDVLVKAQFGN